MSVTRKEATGPVGSYRRAAAIEKPDFPAKRRRPTVKDHSADPAVTGPIESLDGVVHEWVRQYQPALFERIRSKEAQVKELAAQAGAQDTEARMQEALRQRLDMEKRELVALVWDAIGLFEGKPLTEPEIQGRQLGLLIEMTDSAGQTLFVPRGLVDQYLKEGYQLVAPAPPTE